MTKTKKNKKAYSYTKQWDVLVSFVIKYYSQLLFLGIIILCIFLRFYDINNLNPFGWDQVDNAWAAKHIIVDHQLPLLGMQAKGNSGIYIGPLYYYLISGVYFLTGLDPIASGIFAGLTGIFSVVVIFLVTKKLFSTQIALIATFLNTVAFFGIMFDRVQWPVDFIPAVSLIIFYCLYKIILGNSKYIILLSITLGFSFHIHFTSLFYPIIILFVLPFFSWNKTTFKHIVLGILILAFFIAPIAFTYISNMQSGSQFASYSHSYYHGLHLRRVIQITGDAIIQFDPYLRYKFLLPVKFVLVPLFVGLFLLKDRSRQKYLLSYLVILFFLVPWIVLSTYSGELTDYYFSVNRFIALFILAYLIYFVFSIRNMFTKVIVVVLLGIYAYQNIGAFLNSGGDNSIGSHRQKALNAIKSGEKVPYYEGVSDSYFYFYYMRKDGVRVY